MTTKSWKRLLWALGIVSKGEDGFRLINDDTYFHARAVMRDFRLRWHKMVKTTEFLCRGSLRYLFINGLVNSFPSSHNFHAMTLSPPALTFYFLGRNQNAFMVASFFETKDRLSYNSFF